MEKVEDVLFRLRWLYEVKTDKELAKALNISYKTLDGWKFRKSLPEKRIKDLVGPDKVNFEWLFSGNGRWCDNSMEISNNTNSVIVNGSIVNGHQVKVSQELMDFVELFKEYGSNAMLKKWKSELEANKARMQEDEIDEETIKYLFKSVKNFNENPELTSKALNQIMKTFNKVKEYDLNSGRKKAEELGSASE